VAFQRSRISGFAARPPLLASSPFTRETAVVRHNDEAFPLRAQKFMSTEAQEEEEEYPRFEDKPNLHPSSKIALKKMGLETMTEIQAKTFDAAASGQDILARARTGTGKTMAFLLPALNRIAENPIKGQVNMLILSPTRELASQIANQARQLTSAHSGISYQVMFGGSSRQNDVQQLEKRVPTIIVATPGRLQDHFDNTNIRSGRFSTLFHKTQVLVLDEMDRLLDMGFRKPVEEIMTYLPLHKQTLLFSATLPTGVKQLVKGHMSSNYITVDCIHDADPGSHTNDLVEQSHVVVSQDKVVMATISILLRILEDPNAKLIVFFPTTKMVKFYAELFNHGLERTVIELHSGKSQGYRTSASNRFREVKKGVLFTSDVSARGVDYDDVSHVVQVGMADSRETYIHRLGRTARAGKKGHGVLVLSEIEKGFLKMLQGLDIKVDEELHELAVSPPSERVLQQLDPVLESIRTKRNSSLFKSAEGAYRGMMGYYKGNLSRVGIKSLEKCVEFVNSYALQSGLDQVPTFTERTARNMGMYGVAGIKCAPDERGGSGGGGGGSSSYRGGGGRGEAKSTRNNRSSKNKGEAGWWQ
jgi:ATP-dependent RNA helicase MSS116